MVWAGFACAQKNFYAVNIILNQNEKDQDENNTKFNSINKSLPDIQYKTACRYRPPIINEFFQVFI